MAICAAPALAQQSIQTAFNYNLADDARPGCPRGSGSQSRRQRMQLLESCGSFLRCRSAVLRLLERSELWLLVLRQQLLLLRFGLGQVLAVLLLLQVR